MGLLELRVSKLVLLRWGGLRILRLSVLGALLILGAENGFWVIKLMLACVCTLAAVKYSLLKGELVAWHLWGGLSGGCSFS